MVAKFKIGIRLAIASIAVILAGCGAIPQVRDGEVLRPNQGLVAFYVVSNADSMLTYGDYLNESTFGSRFAEQMVGPKGLFRIKAGKTYHVIPMDAGDYMFSKLNVYPRFAWLQSTNRFKISPNSITYIGHIRLDVSEKGFNLLAFDQELDMRTYLSDTYPTYFKMLDLNKSVVQLHLR